MLSLRNFFKKAPQKLSAWSITKNPEFAGAPQKNVACYLNKGCILLSCEHGYYVATPQLRQKEHWDTLLSAFDDETSAIKTDLVAMPRLNATCEKVVSALALEAEMAGIHSIMD